MSAPPGRHTPDVLRMWTIYESPRDYPGRFVVRGWTVQREPVPDELPTAVVDTLAAARRHVPVGLFRLDRDPDDDPTIVETWL